MSSKSKRTSKNQKTGSYSYSWSTHGGTNGKSQHQANQEQNGGGSTYSWSTQGGVNGQNQYMCKFLLKASSKPKPKPILCRISSNPKSTAF